MGLESTSRSTVTSMREVGGGGLYLRPRCAESCAERPIPVTATRAMTTVRERKERLDSMPVLYPLTCARSERWVVGGIRLRRQIGRENPDSKLFARLPEQEGSQSWSWQGLNESRESPPAGKLERKRSLCQRFSAGRHPRLKSATSASDG